MTVLERWWVKTPEVLLVEDNLGDVALLKEILKMMARPIHLKVVRNGLDALSFLGREGIFSGQPEPDMILLDLNLPKLDGRELLVRIKGDGRWSHIPVMVLTSSMEARDIREVFRLKAEYFIPKPMDLEHCVVLVKRIEDLFKGT
ncbi:MAG TPA: response regulator [bacterium]|nr:response regulator [bacterium]